MTTLAFDTATPATTVALCGAAGGDAEARDDPNPGERPGHATRLMPLATQLLQGAGLGWGDLERIAVGVGPGTFTGLRIGIATARALSRGRGIPLVGVPTLQSLAMNALARDPRPGSILAVLDARRGEVFVGAWRPEDVEHPDREALTTRVLAPQEVAGLLDGLPAPILAIGDGALAFRSVLERSGALVPDGEEELHRVTATNHCKLARRLPGEAPEHVGPRYMRLPDAELSRRAAQQP